MSGDRMNILVCVRLGDQRGQTVRDSLQGQCDGCGAGVWTSKASLVRIAMEGSFVRLCLQCVETRTKGREAEIELLPMSEGQAAEIRQAFDLPKTDLT